MAVRSAGGGQLDRIMRRLGGVSRFMKIGQAAPGRTLQQERTQGAPLPRPPAQGPAAEGRPATSVAAPTQPVEAESPLAEGQPIVVPAPGETGPGVPAAVPEPGALIGDIQESPAVGYWRKHGMMPNFWSLQVMTTRRQLEIKLGRPPTSREIAQSLSERDASADASVTPTI